MDVFAAHAPSEEEGLAAFPAEVGVTASLRGFPRDFGVQEVLALMNSVAPEVKYNFVLMPRQTTDSKENLGFCIVNFFSSKDAQEASHALRDTPPQRQDGTSMRRLRLKPAPDQGLASNLAASAVNYLCKFRTGDPSRLEEPLVFDRYREPVQGHAALRLVCTASDLFRAWNSHVEPTGSRAACLNCSRRERTHGGLAGPFWSLLTASDRLPPDEEDVPVPASEMTALRTPARLPALLLVEI